MKNIQRSRNKGCQGIAPPMCKVNSLPETLIPLRDHAAPCCPKAPNVQPHHSIQVRSCVNVLSIKVLKARRDHHSAVFFFFILWTFDKVISLQYEDNYKHVTNIKHCQIPTSVHKDITCPAPPNTFPCRKHLQKIDSPTVEY